jgi:hypothetical protein
MFERAFISGVTHLSGGAHPSSMPPAYGWDMKALKAYADAAKDPGDWERCKTGSSAQTKQATLPGSAERRR